MISRREEKGMKYISVVVPEDIDRELRFACADQATTKSRLVRRLIEQYLDEWREGFEGMGGQIIGCLLYTSGNFSESCYIGTNHQIAFMSILASSLA